MDFTECGVATVVMCFDINYDFPSVLHMLKWKLSTYGLYIIIRFCRHTSSCMIPISKLSLNKQKVNKETYNQWNLIREHLNVLQFRQNFQDNWMEVSRWQITIQWKSFKKIFNNELPYEAMNYFWNI